MDLSTVPERLAANFGILTSEEKDLVAVLLSQNQHHLFSSWDFPGTNDEKKHELLKHLAELDHNCGRAGISGYLIRAKSLLAASRAGENPFDGWTPSVPTGSSVSPFTKEYERYEALGIPFLGKCGFVLVAGGLGERLGYHGIKVELPVETVTKRSYLEHYCQQILAIQQRYAVSGLKLPLAIMVSDDTKEKTEALLEKHNYFELDKSQITLVKQGKVPALISNDAEIAMVSPYEVDSKPHGHGDVHSLLHRSGTAKAWLAQGIEYIVFFQDTNGLSFFTLPAMLGVSEALQLDVNSMAVPRYAKQAIGALAKLTHIDGREMTVNVEYNQLDPLLRATINPEGDVNDVNSGFSPFPGNINQLLFRLAPYVTVLDATHGQMPEFVNPKYKDASKTYFKKATRLECMMQDYPKLLLTVEGMQQAKVGFTNAPAWICYSPCKNNPTDAAASIASGVPAASPFTAESDQYFVFCEMLRVLGADVKTNPDQTILGIPAHALAPRVVFVPSFAIFPHEVQKRFASPQAVYLGKDATLIVEGDVTIDTLRVDGSLHISAVEGSTIVVNTKKRVVHNAGHTVVLLEDMEKSQAYASNGTGGATSDVIAASTDTANANESATENADTSTAPVTEPQPEPVAEQSEQGGAESAVEVKNEKAAAPIEATEIGDEKKGEAKEELEEKSKAEEAKAHEVTEQVSSGAVDNPLLAATQASPTASSSGETALAAAGDEALVITEADQIRGYVILCREMLLASTKDKRREASSNHEYIFDGANVIESEAYEEETLQTKPSSSLSSWCSCIPQF